MLNKLHDIIFGVSPAHREAVRAKTEAKADAKVRAEARDITKRRVQQESIAAKRDAAIHAYNMRNNLA